MLMWLNCFKVVVVVCLVLLVVVMFSFSMRMCLGVLVVRVVRWVGWWVVVMML